MKKHFFIKLLTFFTVICLSVNFFACTANNGTNVPQTSNEPEKIDVTSVTLNKTEMELLEDEAFTLSATVLPENADDKSLVWKSSDESCAIVSEGVVLAVSEGVAEITATSKNGIVAKCTVTVKVDKEPYTFSKFHITTNNGKAITSKDDYVKCTVSVTNASKKYCFENLTGKIKGRGNSTWDMPKKPYKLKFDEKIDLFGNGSSKTWTIIANYADPSLIRNHLAYVLADCFDTLESTTKLHTVDLYVNGKYDGVYLICEQNETGKNRVDISEELDVLDTGYLIELDARAATEGELGTHYFSVASYFHVIKGPDVEDENFTPEHFEFIKNYVITSYNLLLNLADFDQVCEYIDVETFADAYIIHEIMGSVDVGYSSFYMHKDAGGKLKAGPLWDFDISSGNCNYQPNAINTEYLWARDNLWYKKLLKYDEFKALVAQKLNTFDYQKIIDDEIAEILLYEDAYEKNFERWNILGKYVWPNSNKVASIKTWKGQVEYVQQWLTQKLNYIKTVYTVSE